MDIIGSSKTWLQFENLKWVFHVEVLETWFLKDIQFQNS